ncbi:unnamed protein product [Blepharisma stoltei]|uniref:Major facilitator superfamily (MFS) profile domain-containing protein n=1 Tax=Blepharisma stoltei TaxID=1481888 RepID=A0AAU9JS07_9CILI|nr:unnamed protein product [Blepharisma stoltei]
MKVDFCLLSIFISTLLINLIYTVISPFYPIIAQDKGMPDWLVGVVFMIMPACGFLVSPTIGENLSHIGRRNVLALGMVFGAISLIILTIVSNYSLTIFTFLSLVSRALGGIGVSAVYIAGFSIIVNDYNSTKDQNISTLEVFSGFGMMIGPVFGSFCYNFLGAGGCFTLSAILHLLPLPMILMYIKNKSPEIEEKEEITCWGLLKKRSIFLDIMVGLFTNIVYNFFDPCLGPFLKNEGYSDLEIGYVFMASTIAYTLGSIYLVFYLKNANKHLLMLISVALAIIGLAMTGPLEQIMKQPILSALGMCLIALGGCLGFIIPLPYILDSAEDLGIPEGSQLYDSLSTVFNCSISLGEILGPLFAGILVSMIGFSSSCTLMGIFGFIFLIWYVALRKTNPSKLNIVNTYTPEASIEMASLHEV